LWLFVVNKQKFKKKKSANLVIQGQLELENFFSSVRSFSFH